MFTGIGASPGFAIGEALVYTTQKIRIEKHSINNIENEFKRFKDAINISKTQIEAIKKVAMMKFGTDKAAIFEAHGMVLEDPELISQVNFKIQEQKVNAEYAVKEIIDNFIASFEAMEDEYIKERATDIGDVGTRILKNLMGIQMLDLSTLPENTILVVDDLTPSDTATMDKENVQGFVTDIGGRTSHTAIMARSLEVPAIVGLHNITGLVKNGDVIVFDGTEGSGYINPDEEILRAFKVKKDEYEALRRARIALKEKPTVSMDGRRIELAANIGTPNDVKGVLENGGEGIGLYRTEFLYMNRSKMPTEEEQYKAYKDVLVQMGDKPVIIRTLDIGGDKELPYMKLPKEMNPFLGYRAIRICLDQPELFKVQLRALLRASVHGNLKIMYPMISSVEEVRAANKILQEVKDDFDNKDITYNKAVEVGIMIEIPAAAIIGDLLIKEVDFFSIGTNDLIQYTVAVDRMNEKISMLYEPFHPAILRMIKLIIDHAHGAGKRVGMCGEMAGDTRIIPILFGLGLDKFSMGAGAILEARQILCGLSYHRMREISEGVLNLSTAEEIKSYLENHM